MSNQLIGFGADGDGGNDGFTKLLLHMDGADAATSFPDASTLGVSVTASGNAQVDTAQSKFNGASALFDGTGDYLTVADNAAWDVGTGPFTVDFWVRWNALATRTFLFDFNSDLIRLEKNASDIFDIVMAGASVGTRTPSPVLATGTWYHVALLRTGTALRLYLNGAQMGADITNSTNVTAVANIIVGAHNGSLGSLNHNGWIDEFRISTVARWTANFTPLGQPYG